MDSIEWTKITKPMKVVDTGTHWEAAGKLVTWGSRDAKQAQMWLKGRAKADKNGTQRSVLSSDPSYAKLATEHGKIRCKGCIHTKICEYKKKPRLIIGTFCSYKQTKRS